MVGCQTHTVLHFHMLCVFVTGLNQSRFSWCDILTVLQESIGQLVAEHMSKQGLLGSSEADSSKSGEQKLSKNESALTTEERIQASYTYERS